MCKSCTLKTYNMLERRVELVLRVCPECEAIDVGSGWSQPGEVEKRGLLNIARDEITGRISAPQPGRMEGLDIESVGKDEYLMGFIIRARVEVCGEIIDKDGTASVKIRRALCDSCSRARGNYYEAVLQLRADGRKLQPEEIERCVDIIYEAIDMQRLRGDMNSFVSAVQTLKEGTDFYIGSSKVARRIANVIERSSGAETLETSSLAGRKDGKEIYRISISIRLPRIRTDDVVRVGGELMVIENAGRRLKGYLLPSHKPWETGQVDAEPVCRLDEARNGVVVTVEANDVQVVEPWGNRCVVLR